MVDSISRRWPGVLAAGALAGCSSVPHGGDTALANVRCETVGQGIALEADVTSVLDVGQHLEMDVAFVDDSTVVQVAGGETWTCVPWTEVDGGGAIVGCGPAADQPTEVQLDYRVDVIVTEGTLPIPPVVRVAPVVFAAGIDSDSAIGDPVETDCTSP